jgi:hypothetical protein
MAGILPTAIHKGKRYYLIGRESKFPESGLYADFGGHKDKGESILNTAIREGFEETIGIIGDKKKIGSLIKNKLYKKIKINNDALYIIKIKYDKDLPKKFDNKYKTLCNFLKKSPKNIQNKFEIYIEKDKIKWVTKEQLLSNKKSLRKLFIKQAKLL